MDIDVAETSHFHRESSLYQVHEPGLIWKSHGMHLQRDAVAALDE